LSQQSDYFVVESSRPVETGKPESLKEEKQPRETSTDKHLSLAAKVGLGIGGLALPAVLLALLVHKRSRRSRNENNKRKLSAAIIVRDESLISCIVPDEVLGLTTNKECKVIDEEETETAIMEDDNLEDTASQVFRRIMSQSKETETAIMEDDNLEDTASQEFGESRVHPKRTMIP
jgi:hypothetical protein